MPTYDPANGIISIVTRLWAGLSRVHLTTGARDFLFFKTTRANLEPIMHIIQWIPM